MSAHNRRILDERTRRDLIVASAWFHAQPPSNRGPRSSCAKVLRHAMYVAGEWKAELEVAFHGVEHSEYDPERHPADSWYATLIEMTCETPKSSRLLLGEGNLVTPAAARFTGCWLTPAGEARAAQLLAEHPEWQPKLMTEPAH
jgi:hypothetical protein